MEIFEDLFNPSFLQNTNERPALPKDATVTMAYVPLQEGLAKTIAYFRAMKG